MKTKLVLNFFLALIVAISATSAYAENNDKLNKKVRALSQQIKQIRASLYGTNEKALSKEVAKASLTNRIENLESGVSALTESVTEISAAIDSLNLKLAATLDALENTGPSVLVEIAGNMDAGSVNYLSDSMIDDLEGSFGELAHGGAEFSTVADIPDSLGNRHTVTFVFFKQNVDQWNVRGYVDGSEISNGIAGTPFRICNFDMTFDGTGLRPPSTLPDAVANLDWSNGAGTSTVKIDMRSFTQYAAASNILSISVD